MKIEDIKQKALTDASDEIGERGDAFCASSLTMIGCAVIQTITRNFAFDAGSG